VLILVLILVDLVALARGSVMAVRWDFRIHPTCAGPEVESSPDGICLLTNPSTIEAIMRGGDIGWDSGVSPSEGMSRDSRGDEAEVLVLLAYRIDED
jgi:hypothetical protein